MKAGALAKKAAISLLHDILWYYFHCRFSLTRFSSHASPENGMRVSKALRRCGGPSYLILFVSFWPWVVDGGQD